ncbi:hypothetical protein N7454_009139 [Penicillium verhagenii]|nr:hypothetical protein N7454_009139 [Penicillium verhagenii]
MRATRSHSNILLDLDREVDVLSSLADCASIDQRETPLPDMSNKHNNYPVADYNGLTAAGSSPGSLPPHLVGLTRIPVSSSSSPRHSSGLQPSLGYGPVPSESTRSFLAPEEYRSEQRASPVSDAMGSLYTWSSASDAEMLRPPASMDPIICSATSSPFMQSYFTFDSPRPL